MPGLASGLTFFLGGILLLITSGCAQPRPLSISPAAPPPPASAKHAYLVSHGWHVGIAMARADVSTAVWPESAALGDLRYLEVGWGDGDYYPAERGSPLLALKAAFRSDWSVLHVAAFDEPVPEFFADAKIIEIPLSPRGFNALTRFIHAAYARDAAGHIVVVAPGSCGRSHFYRATGHYGLAENSNNWTARALEAAGCPIDPGEVITAGGLMERAVEFGRVIRPGRLRPEAAATEAGRERCR